MAEPGLRDLVVDGGRFMMGRFGLARGGPRDAWTAAQANHLIGNPPDAPTIEMSLRGPTLLARADGVAGFAGWGLQPLRNGVAVDCFSLVTFTRGDVIGFRPLPYGSCAYVALPGGVDSARFAGSASVDVRAGIGRPLVAGDVLGSVAGPEAVRRVGVASASINSVWPEPVRLRVVRGPQASDEALAVLCDHTFVVRGADRMGVRLAGPGVPGFEVVSEATPLGAIQVPPDGAPIILLNDRGTLGGYSKPALVDPRDLDRVGRLFQGQRVAFHCSEDGRG